MSRVKLVVIPWKPYLMVVSNNDYESVTKVKYMFVGCGVKDLAGTPEPIHPVTHLGLCMPSCSIVCQ